MIRHACDLCGNLIALDDEAAITDGILDKKHICGSCAPKFEAFKARVNEAHDVASALFKERLKEAQGALDA